MSTVPSSVLESGDEASKGTSTVRTKVSSDRAVCHVGYWVVQLRPLVMIISCFLRPPQTMIVPKAICCEAIQAGLQWGLVQVNLAWKPISYTYLPLPSPCLDDIRSLDESHLSIAYGLKETI